MTTGVLSEFKIVYSCISDKYMFNYIDSDPCHRDSIVVCFSKIKEKYIIFKIELGGLHGCVF